MFELVENVAQSAEIKVVGVGGGVWSFGRKWVVQHYSCGVLFVPRVSTGL